MPGSTGMILHNDGNTAKHLATTVIVWLNRESVISIQGMLSR